MQEMWNKLFSQDLVLWVKKKTGETEDFDTVGGFFEHIKQRVDYRNIVILSTQWHTYDKFKQTNMAINYAGTFHASRFMLMMDFLSERFLEGKLK